MIGPGGNRNHIRQPFRRFRLAKPQLPQAKTVPSRLRATSRSKAASPQVAMAITFVRSSGADLARTSFAPHDITFPIPPQRNTVMRTSGDRNSIAENLALHRS